MRLNRRPIVAIGACLFMTAAWGAHGSPPVDDWPSATLAEAGFAPDLGDRIDAGVREGRYENLHGVVVVRGGNLVLERYYEGEDEIWGRSQGRVAFGPDTLHDLRSVTKSIVGLLYGIALTDGVVPAPEALLIDHFPEYPDLAEDPMRRRITVAHTLSMMMGTEWDERLPYWDPRNSEHAMELADDRYRFVLDRRMVAEPGSQWTYNGGATAVLSRLIAAGSGQSLRDYAEARLFGPLGIGDYEWVRGSDGEFIAASGLRLRPRDLARIGQLVLDGGRWDGAQIVPADWLARSFETRATVDDLGYGYQWWLGPQTTDGPDWIAGFGNGGQRLLVVPDADLVVVVTAGNYNQPDAWQLPVAITREIFSAARDD